MSFTIAGCDATDLTLLLRATNTAGSMPLNQLTCERLQAISDCDGLDFATAVLYHQVRRRHFACSERLDELYRTPAMDAHFNDCAFVYVPNLGYLADPKSRTVGAAVCSVAESAGCRSYEVETEPTEDLRANGRIVCEALAKCQEQKIVLMSVSKGSADVKMALRADNGGRAFRNVVAWIDVCGLANGTPVVNPLATACSQELKEQIVQMFRNRDPAIVRGCLAVAHELGYGKGFPLHDPVDTPSHIMRLNVVGFPTRRHLANDVSRALYESASRFGPSDGYGVLREMVTNPGDVYPIWGTDHYFHNGIDVQRLAATLLAYVAEQLKRSNVRSSIGASPVAQPKHVGDFSNASVHRPPIAELRDARDWERVRHGRSRHDGFPVGRYLQPAPMLFTRDGHNVFLGDFYRGRPAFLLGGGPSLADHDLAQLNRRGVLTCAMNNAATVYRPQLWVSVDDPGNFADAIWRDPGILKFVPLCHMEKPFTVRNENDELVESEECVGDMPAILGYRRNERFREAQWLFEDTFNWGNHSNQLDSSGNKGSRSVMYVAIRLLFYLGVRKIYLLGCDFRMKQGEHNYAFAQDRTRSSVRGNNDSYRILNQRLGLLKPYFDQEGLEIVNCTPESGLTVFPFQPFEHALAEAVAEMPQRINTIGMYDRQQRLRDQAALAGSAADSRGAGRARPDSAISLRHSSRPLELTLVTAVDREHLPKLALTWPTWMLHRPELRETPVIVIHDESLQQDSAEFDFLREHPQLRLVSWRMSSAQSQREKMLTSFVMVPAREVTTQWYLKIDADVFAKPCDQWIKSEWFARDAKERLPAFVSSPWGYTKPAHALQILDDWADAIPQLKDHQRLNIPYAPDASRIRHPRIASWCFYGNTAWTREIAAYSSERLPLPSHDTYLFYCAARRQDHFVRAPMSQYGWQHVAGSVRRLSRCCKQTMELCPVP